MRYALCRRCHHPASVHDLVHGRRVLILRCGSCPDGLICAWRRLPDVECERSHGFVVPLEGLAEAKARNPLHGADLLDLLRLDGAA